MTRARALSPLRILSLLMALPIMAGGVALSVYVRTSPYDPALAVRHLAALAGCDAAQAMALAPARRGEPGYHARNDADGDGVACGPRTAAAFTSAPEVPQPGGRMAGGAKFVRP